MILFHNNEASSVLFPDFWNREPVQRRSVQAIRSHLDFVSRRINKRRLPEFQVMSSLTLAVLERGLPLISRRVFVHNEGRVNRR